MADLFDPIRIASEVDQEILSAAKRREIQNILKSYVGFYDPFAELIQNAMDAVDERDRRLDEADYMKRLWIDIDLKANSFSVTDNGIGFGKQQFQAFLAPNITFKTDENTRGKKGVGATYLAYGFNYLQLGTRSPDYEVVAEIKDGRTWVEDSKGVVPRPRVTDSKLLHEPFAQLQRGSTFTLRFEGNNIRPSDLSWIGATTAEQWRTVLLVKSPLGHVALGESDSEPIYFSIRVVDRDGGVTEVNDAPAIYIFPHTVIGASADLAEILAEQQKRLEKQQDPGTLPARFQRLNGLHMTWDTTSLHEQFAQRDPDIAALIEQYQIAAYGYFCYSVRIWDQFNDEIARLRKGQRVLRGGLQLATDNMPQGDLFVIPLTSNIGYQNQSHVVVHFRNADPDLGRKGFQPELRHAAEQIAVIAVNVLKKRRHLLKKDSGAVPQIAERGKVFDWLVEQQEHERQNPLSISNPNFFVPVNDVSITSCPASEQDVIVLFNQLLAGGVIRGIRVMATSQHEQYDSVFRYVVTEPLENHVFDSETNPLGVEELRHDRGYRSKPSILEYKYNVDALISEFESEQKQETEVDLVVAWQMGQEYRRRYQVTSLLDLTNLQHRPFHGLTHLFQDDNSGEIRFYGIILEDLVAYLHDPDRSQEEQRERYGLET